MGGYIHPEDQKVPASRALKGMTSARICRAVCAYADISWDDLFSQTRGISKIANARAIAMYLIRVGLGRSLTEIGDYFGRHHTSVMTAIRRVHETAPMKRDFRALKSLLLESDQDFKPTVAQLAAQEDRHVN